MTRQERFVMKQVNDEISLRALAEEFHHNSPQSAYIIGYTTLKSAIQEGKLVWQSDQKPQTQKKN